MFGKKIWGEKLLPKATFFGGFAAEIAFYFSLSLVPFLVVTFTMLGQLVPVDLSVEMSKILQDMLPTDARLNTESILASAKNSAKGGWLTATFFLAVWTAFRFMSSCVRTLHFIVEDESRQATSAWLRSLGALWLMLVWMLTLVLTALFLVVAVPIEGLLKSVDLISGPALMLWSVARGLVVLGILYGAFFLTYQTVRNKTLERAKAVQAAAIAAVGWFVLSYAFSHVVPRLLDYNQLYGALGSVIVFLLWAYFCAWVFILGGCWMVRTSEVKPAQQRPLRKQAAYQKSPERTAR